VDNKHGAGFSIADSENEVAQARLAFHEGLQAATEAGTRSLAAARRFAVPALWGAVLVGGAVAVFTVARLVRRRRRENALFRIVVEPARSDKSLARTAGAAIARLALERLLSSVSDAARARVLGEGISGEVLGTLERDHRRRLDSSSVQRNSTTNGRQETIC
jgi:hypothetical protein